VVAEVELPVGPALAQSWEKRAAEQVGQHPVRDCGLDTCMDTILLNGPVRQPMWPHGRETQIRREDLGAAAQIGVKLVSLLEHAFGPAPFWPMSPYIRTG
jgi:hypothetical protein